MSLHPRSAKLVFATPLFFLAGLPAFSSDSPADAGLPPPWVEQWNVHFQATTVTQAHGEFTSPYQGPNSLESKFEIPSSFTSTLFVGHTLWKDAVIFANPEVAAGSGLSGTHGVAAFPNGEIYRVADPDAQTNLARLFVQQDFGLGGGVTEELPDGQNQFRATKDVERITVVAGKFSLNDYFDENVYAHDPRTQFLNWAMMDNPAWDYAADTRGYTWGMYTELRLSSWSFRAALVQEPAVANGADLEGDIKHGHALNGEIERRYVLNSHPGSARLLGYLNQAHMGSYEDSIALAQETGTVPDVTKTEVYRSKYGAGFGIEQELTSDLGVFSRLGWNDGATESWAFTEADRVISAGASVKGAPWGRVQDVLGVAFNFNGLSKAHADYLTAGGLGFMLGDGRLSYAPEQVFEAYYSFRVISEIAISPDFQYVVHPGYNADRGPVPIYAVRLHGEF